MLVNAETHLKIDSEHSRNKQTKARIKKNTVEVPRIFIFKPHPSAIGQDLHWCKLTRALLLIRWIGWIFETAPPTLGSHLCVSIFTWSCPDMAVDKLKVSLKSIGAVSVSFCTTVCNWGKELWWCRSKVMMMMVLMRMIIIATPSMIMMMVMKKMVLWRIYHEVVWKAEDDWEQDAWRWKPGCWVHPSDDVDLEW